MVHFLKELLHDRLMRKFAIDLNNDEYKIQITVFFRPDGNIRLQYVASFNLALSFRKKEEKRKNASHFPELIFPILYNNLRN